MRYLIVVDMQNDFINGTLGTEEAEKILPRVAKKVMEHDGPVLFTRDTHGTDYLQTQEGKNLPVEHCVQGTPGWQIADVLQPLAKKAQLVVDKPTFGSRALAEYISGLKEFDQQRDAIELVGLCTDICVISNALVLKAFLPETTISVDASCCAGVTPESHANALAAMKMCQIQVTGEERA